MSGQYNQISFGGGILNTLAQKETQKSISVGGDGISSDNITQLKKWAKRKVITKRMMLALIDIAKSKNANDRMTQYWNTYYCVDRFYKFDNRLYGKYCKNKFCALCLSIRKAEILNNYLPYLQTWNKAYFVTLTIKSIPSHSVKILMDNMVMGFNKIIETYRKRHIRGTGIQLMGIKSLECNFNPVKRTYNPHFHIIVPTKEMADILKSEWLSRSKKKKKIVWTYHEAQDIREVKNMDKCLVEVVKYGVKIFVDKHGRKRRKGEKVKKEDQTIYAAALDNIIEAMQGRRLFDRFGFNLPKNFRTRTRKKSMLYNYEEILFSPEHSDWISQDTNERLSKFALPEDLEFILKNQLNTAME